MKLASSLRVRAVIASAILVVSLTACSGNTKNNSQNYDSEAVQTLLNRAPVATAEELAGSPTAAAIKQRGELLVGSVLDAPLLSQQNPITGEVEGFDAVLSMLFAKYILGEPNRKIVNSTPQIREPLLQNGTVDTVFMAYTITEERAQRVSFAGPYFISGPAIATTKDKTGITKPEDLNGKKVIAITGTTGIEVTKKLAPQAEIVTFGTTPEAIQALEQGRGDAYVGDLINLAGSAYVNDKIKVVTPKPITDDPYGIGVKLGDTSFKTFINNWLTKIEDAGIWQDTYRETFGKGIPGDVPTPPKIGSVPGS